MQGSIFTSEERARLFALDAVRIVTPTRIYYTPEFRSEVMRRYRAGESPSKIFAEAGLPSSLIGYKRIERCVARWHAEEVRRERAAEDRC